MNKKTIFTSLLAIAVFIIAIYVYLGINKNNFTAVDHIFKSIRGVSQIDFEQVDDVTIDWRTESGIKTLKAKQISARTSFLNSQKLDEFFNQTGFEIDLNNVADGTTSSLAAYENQQLTCTYLARGEYEEFTMPEDNSIVYIEIKCALSNQL